MNVFGLGKEAGEPAADPIVTGGTYKLHKEEFQGWIQAHNLIDIVWFFTKITRATPGSSLLRRELVLRFAEAMLQGPSSALVRL